MENQETPINPIVARMRAKHADKPDLADDDMFPLADEHIGELEDYQKRNTEMNAKLDEIIKQNPSLAATILDMDSGYSWEEALVRNNDISALKEMEEDLEDSKLQEAKAYRQTRQSESEAFESTLNENKEFSQSELRAFAEENGMDEAQALDFVEKYVSPMLDDLAQLKIGRNVLALLHKAATADDKILEAQQTGELRGKNAKADEIMKETVLGDGLPKAGSSMVMAEPETPKKKGYIASLQER